MDFFSMLLKWLNSLPGAAALGMVWGIMAIGVYITYKILDVADLTVDGTICTGAATCALFITQGFPIPVAIIAAIIAGMLAGFVTGILHTLLGIPAILAGILTQLMLWSVNLKIMGTPNISIPNRKYDLWVSLGDPWGSILVLAIFIAVLIGILYWFFGTEAGSAIRATGNNLQMSKAQGINTDFTKILGLVISNGVVGLSGALLAQYNSFADISMGNGAIVTGLAAIIIGDVVVSRFARNFALRLVGVIVGGIIYYFVYQTIIFIGLDTDLLKLLAAVVVAAFLAAPYVKKRYFKKTKPSGGGKNA